MIDRFNRYFHKKSYKVKIFKFLIDWLKFKKYKTNIKTNQINVIINEKGKNIKRHTSFVEIVDIKAVAETVFVEVVSHAEEEIEIINEPDIDIIVVV